ncbi:MAG: sulfotransferase [Bauldia sp.]|nr:sulfotransferase [Bauldia sp.]
MVKGRPPVPQARVGGRPAAPVDPRTLPASEAIRRGVALHQEGRLREAEAFYQGVLFRLPDHADANNHMGTLAVAAGRMDLAVGYFEKAVRGRPSDVRYLNNLGNALVLSGNVEDGMPLLEKVLSRKPLLYETLCNIGRAYLKRGQGERGLWALRKAVALRPDGVQGLIGLADSLLAIGENEEAIPLFRKVYDTGQSIGTAAMGLASARKHQPDDNDLALVRGAIENPLIEEQERTILHYAAAKIAIDIGDIDESFRHLSAAKSTARAFDDAGFDRLIGGLEEVFTPDFFAATPIRGSESERPIFIVGMPRSGTSLTEQILASHGDVTGAGELPHMIEFANAELDFSDPAAFRRAMGDLGQAKAAELAARYLAKLDFHSGEAARVTDKMPHNFLMLGVIALLFPRAKIIHCRRNPLDNCVSIYTNWFNEKHGYAADQVTLGRYYRQYDRLMKHWSRVLPVQVFDVQYEELVSDLETVARRMVDFIGLPWDPACLRFHETKRGVTTISRWQVRQPIYNSSVGRWKAFERHIGPLISALA